MRDPYDTLLNPKEVGSSEYRLVHEFVTDLREDGADYLLIQSSLDELSRWARKVLIDYTRVSNTF